MLSRFVIAFLLSSKCLNFMASVTVHSNFGTQEYKMCYCFHFSPIYLPWSDGTKCYDLSFFLCWVLSQFYHSPLSPSSKVSLVPLHFLLLEWYHLHVYEVVDASLWFIQHSISYDGFCIEVKKQDDNTQLYGTCFPILHEWVVSCLFLTVASWPAYRFLRK